MYRMLRFAVALSGSLAIIQPAAGAAPPDAVQESAARKVQVSGIVRDGQNAVPLRSATTRN